MRLSEAAREPEKLHYIKSLYRIMKAVRMDAKSRKKQIHFYDFEIRQNLTAYKTIL